MYVRGEREREGKIVKMRGRSSGCLFNATVTRKCRVSKNEIQRYFCRKKTESLFTKSERKREQKEKGGGE